MKRLLPLFQIGFIVLFTGYLLNAQVLEGPQANQYIPGAQMVRMDKATGVPKYIKLQPANRIAYQNFLPWLKQVTKLDVSMSFQLLRKFSGQLEQTHYRYQQMYDGYPVEGGIYIAHVSQNGQLISANGNLVTPLKIDGTPSISEQQALQQALDHVGANVYKWEVPAEERNLKQIKNDPDATYFPDGKLVLAPKNGTYKPEDYRLAYKFDVYAHQPMSRAYVYVDARTGQVIHTLNRIHENDVTATANSRYSGTITITTDSVSSTSYRLRETGRGGGIETYDLNESTNYGGAVDFTDSDNFWNNWNADQDEVATDAHWATEITYDYYMNEHSRNSYDDAGSALLSYVHYGTDYNNAFWDGSRMTYGDGDSSSFYPLTSLDICGHEVTHGVTDYTADLVYQDEPGALNESFSDIFGQTIEFYGKSGSWRIGEDATPSGNGIRNMANPNEFGDPDTYQGTNWYTGNADNGGVHTNSGVQNFWYYVLTVGDTGTNDLGDSYSVPGVGLDTSQDIAYRNLAVYLSTNSQYADARFYAIESAKDLYGDCSDAVIQTTNAWYAVGVGNEYDTTITSDFTADQTFHCSLPATVNFNNLSTGSNGYYWDFGDGNTSTNASPTHSYADTGSYTVTLVAYGCTGGSDTLVRTNYVTVDTTASMCDTILVPTSGVDTVTKCSGYLFDDGGPTNDYSNSTDGVVSIQPPGATSITLNFSSFHYEAGYDYLEVYDGPSTGSPLIGQYDGNTLPNGGTITSSGGAITVRQYSDNFVTELGFEATFQCSVAPPTADFYSPDTNSCSGDVQFYDLSQGGTSWYWEFGDGDTSAQQNPLHTYTANGTYNITLVTCNSLGCDTLSKTAYIDVSMPSAPTATGDSSCGPDSLQLSATGTGSGELQWYDAPTGGNLLDTGNTYTTPYLTSSSTYYVEEKVEQPSQYVGPPDNTYGSGGYYNNDRHLIFDVFSAATLVSVKVYAGSSGNRTIELRDNVGNVLQDTTINIPSGTQRITLNFDLTPGTNYQLGIGGTGADLYRNSSNTSYPYTLPGILSITGCNAPDDYYYFYYDWEVKELPCRSSRTSVTADVDSVPNLSVAPSDSNVVCNGDSVQLTASGATSYSWSPANGLDTTAGSTVMAGPTSSTTYQLIGSDNFCNDTADVYVGVSGNVPVADFTVSSTTVCVGDTVTMDGSTSSFGSNYTWVLEGTSPADPGQPITDAGYGSAGTYDVKLVVSNGCGVDSMVKPDHITVAPSPAVSVTPNAATICLNDTITLSASGANTYSWSPASGLSATSGATVQASPNTTTTYQVVGMNSSGCSDTNSVTITVGGSAVVADFTVSDDSICAGGQLTVDGSNSANASNYSWTLNGGTPSTSTQTTTNVTYNTAGTYDVKLVVSNSCSMDSLIKQDRVTVSPQPAVTVTPDQTTICEGKDVTLTASAGISVNYTWSTGDTDSAITISPQSSQTVIVEGENNGCKDSDTASITVKPKPIAGFGYSVNKLEVIFSDSSTNANSYNWDFGDGNTSTFANPTHTYSTPDTYQVELVVTHANGCTDKVTKTIIVGSTGIVDHEDKPRLTIHPVPVRQYLYLNIQLPEQADVRFKLFNALGQQLEQVMLKDVRERHYRMDVRDYPQGIYFIKYKVGDEVRVRKVTIQR